jgi:4-alpha-glucanotransferase
MPLVHALRGYTLGTLGELFDGEPPHAPRGAVAQAWSVAELIAAPDVTENASMPCGGCVVEV